MTDPAPFDANEYEARVVKPLRELSSKRYPDALAQRYALSGDLTDEQLLHRVDEVRAHWAAALRLVALAPTLQRVYRSFQHADRRLVGEHGTELADAGWWRARIAEEHQERRTATDRLVTLLHDAYGSLAAITPAMLAELQLAFPEFTASEITAAVGEAGLSVTEPTAPSSVDIAERVRHGLSAGLPAPLLLRHFAGQLDDPEAAGPLVLAMLDKGATPRHGPLHAASGPMETTTPPPVRSLEARLTGLHVKLSWTPGDDGARRYLLVRNVDHEPRTIDDGEVVHDGPDRQAVDRNPPIAHEVRYAVFAGVPGGGTWSDGRGAGVEVLPPVVLRDARSDGDRLLLSWRVHPGAVAVHVIRQPSHGAQSQTILRERLDAFDDEFDTGAPCFYEVRPVYRLGAAEVPGESFRFDSSDTQLFQQRNGILEVDVKSASIGRTPRVEASWPRHPGHDVRIRFSSSSCPWRPGDRISPAELDQFGAELHGERLPRGKRTVLTADVPSGRLTYVPFAGHADEIVVGQAFSFTAATPVTGARAERRGGEILVSWIWPDGTPEVTVRWSGPDGSGELTLSEYDYEVRGCRIPYGAAAIDVEILAAVSSPGSGVSYSLPVKTSLPARLPRLTYSVRVRGGPWSRTRKAVVTLTALDRLGPCEVLVGTLPPGAATDQTDDLEVLSRFFVALDKEATEDCVVDLAAGVSPAGLVCVPAVAGTVTVIPPLTKPR